MTEDAGKSKGNTLIWVGAVGAALLIAALVVTWQNGSDVAETDGPPPETPAAEAPPPADAAPPQAAPPQAAPPVSGEERAAAPAPGPAPTPAPAPADAPAAPGADTQGVAETRPAPVEPARPAGPAPSDRATSMAGDTVPPPPPPVEAIPPPPRDPRDPSFDVVRLSRDGDTVIAGQAPPGAKVTVRDGDEVLGEVIADDRGEWVLLPETTLEPGSRRLRLEAETPDGEMRTSPDEVVVVVPERGTDVAGRPAETPAQEEPLALLVPAEPAAEGQAPVATRVLQRPDLPGSIETPAGDLALDVIDYDAAGNLRLSGRGLAGADVLIYLDGGFIGGTGVDPAGLWTLVPDAAVDPGVYTLRLDQMVAGKVQARLELPFSRAAPITDFEGDSFIVVQPGNSLWRIARRTLGDGIRYSVIFEANADQIRDPDLIYPGQVFEIPVSN